jgi:hypothetical protein
VPWYAVKVRLSPLLLPALLLPAFSGCTRSAATSAPRPPSASQLASAREDLALIPAPSKSRYLAVKSLTAWENPYLTVQGSMVTLHVLVADANTSDLGVGGLLRPVGARRQNLNVRAADLPAAIDAIPQDAWPYGRVVAVEEAHDVPVSARPEVRRNMEAAIKTLGDVGIVVYEWQDGGASLR